MSIISKLKSKRWKYLLFGSKVTVEPGAELNIAKGVIIKGSTIYLCSGSKLTIGEGTELINSLVYAQGDTTIIIGKKNRFKEFNVEVLKGDCAIGDYNFFERSVDGYPPRLTVNGSLKVGSYNKICCVVWMRFGSVVNIGDHNAINQRTEIRSDESVSIGSYNQISYDCVIWDTNTHNIYSAERRREITDKQYPDFGLEFESPITKEVSIGDDCWIARGVTILKGVKISDKTIIAYNTTITKGEYKPNSTLMNSWEVSEKENNL